MTNKGVASVFVARSFARATQTAPRVQRSESSHAAPTASAMVTPTPTPTPHGEPVGGAAAEAAAAHPVEVVFADKNSWAALAPPKREEAWFVDSLYGSGEEVLARPSVQEMVDEEKLKQTSRQDAELEALGEEVASCTFIYASVETKKPT